MPRLTNKAIEHGVDEFSTLSGRCFTTIKASTGLTSSSGYNLLLDGEPTVYVNGMAWTDSLYGVVRYKAGRSSKCAALFKKLGGEYVLLNLRCGYVYGKRTVLLRALKEHGAIVRDAYGSTIIKFPLPPLQQYPLQLVGEFAQFLGDHVKVEELPEDLMDWDKLPTADDDNDDEAAEPPKPPHVPSKYDF